jgi:uncharacterized protein
MQFTLHCSDGANQRLFYYDNETSMLTDENGRQVRDEKKVVYENYGKVKSTSFDLPNGKDASVKALKIQLGLACNYACQYCSQNTHRALRVEGQPRDVEVFMRNLDTWLTGAPKRIEFWGGEPFAYWKTLKPLAEAMRRKYPKASLLIITNGSLLTREINQWICDIDIDVGISHDGPGQHVRGPDPLDDPEQRKIILDLFRRRASLGKVSFNAMINRQNMDRAAIQKFFRAVLGSYYFTIGEGAFIDPYDEKSSELSLQTHEEALSFRKLALESIRRNKISNFSVMRRVEEIVASISSARPSSALWQKCGMDRPDTLAVDLKGNVLTCQNVSVASRSPNGQSHHLGHVSRLDEVKLKTATHFANRSECRDCPVVQSCKGSCMFLHGPLWEKACNNAYNDQLPFFAAAIERMTGYLPHRIEAPTLPPERSALWE